jgi:ribulose-phosphate 3-epimerase
MKKYLIAPSILAADFSCLGEDTIKSLKAGGDLVHFDVMDNQYVPNLTVGPMVLQALRSYGITALIDVHLMTNRVDSLIPKFAGAGADHISFHPETSNHIDRTIQLIKKYGCKVGVAFNPATPLCHLNYIMDKIDTILLMSVNPGYGSQQFISSVLSKIREVRRLIDQSGYDICLQVDGGIKVDNIAQIAAAGADCFIAGSAIFSTPDYQEVIDNMRSELEKAKFSFH